jgi:hypothetical protein
VNQGFQLSVFVLDQFCFFFPLIHFLGFGFQFLYTDILSLTEGFLGGSVLCCSFGWDDSAVHRVFDVTAIGQVWGLLLWAMMMGR